MLHNDPGGPTEAANAVVERFHGELPGLKTPLDDLAANFTDPDSQGPKAYSDQYSIEHPELEISTVKADAIVAVEKFIEILRHWYNQVRYRAALCLSGHTFYLAWNQ